MSWKLGYDQLKKAIVKLYLILGKLHSLILGDRGQDRHGDTVKLLGLGFAPIKL